MEIIHSFLQALCISLFGYSIGLIFWELKTKFDRSFMYFGITIVLLCLFCAIDLWKQPFSFNLTWTNIQHIISCSITPFFIKYLHALTKRQNLNFQKSLFIISGIISILFMLNLMFDIKDTNASPNILYFILFLPYTLFTAFYINFYVIKAFRNSSGFEQKIYFSHLLGFGLITICGLLDFTTLLYNRFFVPVVSFTIFGVIGLGILLSYIFTERLILLIQEKNKTLNDLKLAYTELEEARSLRELGQSSAIVNHEINNYSCAIKGYLELIKLKIDDPERSILWVDKALSSIEYLTQFSNSILDFSKSKILKEKKPLDICERINSTINEHYPEQKDVFHLNGFRETVMIHGDWLKLNHVFLNLFKNAFEAGATKINITLLHKHNITLLTIEDNGCGIDPKKVDSMFKAFFSTKDKKGGTGLGMSIIRAIIEGHGGYINAFSKNDASKESTGIIFNITFPTYLDSSDDPVTNNDNIILIKEKLDPYKEVQKIFQNVFIMPEVIQNFSELNLDKYSKKDTVIIGGPEVIGKLNRKSNKHKHYTIVRYEDTKLFIAGNKPDSYDGFFNEEFILKNLPVA